MKISQLINEDHWLGQKVVNGKTTDIIAKDNMFFTKSPLHRYRNTDPDEAIPKPEARTEPPVGRVHITRKNMIKDYLKHGPKIVAGAALGGAAYIGKKIHDRRKAAKVSTPTRKEMLMSKANEYGNKAKSFVGQHGKKVAAGTLAALGAGVGVKALLKYLRKKKES